MQTKPSVEHYFSVTFIQKTSKFFDIAESQWISRLDAQININKTLLPKFKSSTLNCF